MNGVRTRRQAAIEADSDEQNQTPNGNINGHAIAPKDISANTKLPENIFLFYPNIIGIHGTAGSV